MSHEWGFLIAVYLFFGGVSAGLLIVSSLATLSAAHDRLHRIAAGGAWLAPWPVLVGTGLLVVDLGRPSSFWKLLVAFAPLSPMWLGTWLLTLFSLVSLAYANVYFPRPLRVWNPANLRQWRTRLAAAGLALGIGVGVYTGVLLGVLVARPLWNTPLLAQLFLLSAVSSGAAVLLVLLRHRATDREQRLLLTGDAVAIGAELMVLAWMVIAGRTSTASAAAAVAALTHGVCGWAFWTGVIFIGLLAPLALEAWELSPAAHQRQHSRIVGLAPLFVILGGFALRWIIVYAGQATSFQ
jgi:protein NrfD